MHILDYRKTLKNCAAFSPLVSKGTTPHLTQYWNTSVQKVTFSTVEMALAFLIWVSEYLSLQNSWYSPLQNQVLALLPTENNLHLKNWEFKKKGVKKKTSQGVQKIAK